MASCFSVNARGIFVIITQKHFGGHILLDKDVTDPGSPFANFSATMEMTTYRYPGGTVTEALSPYDGSLDKIFGEPGEVGSKERVVTVKEAFRFASDHDAGIQFVLPTKRFFHNGPLGHRGFDKEGVDDLIQKVDQMIRGEFGDVRIENFEIGNEYWLAADRLSAKEYGTIANYMAVELQRVFDTYRAELANPAAWQEPRIAVQSGAAWRAGENAIIIESLGTEARGAIDTVLTHFYPASYERGSTEAAHFRNMDEFNSAEGFGKLDYLVSEWNIGGKTVDPDLGFEHASALFGIFDHMLKRGVTDANIWGTQYKNLTTRLAEMSHNPSDGVSPDQVVWKLTAAGEVYRMMTQNLIGTQMLGLQKADVLEGSVPEGSDLVVHSYGDQEKVVLFLASRTGKPLDIDLDSAKFAAGYKHVWATEMSALDDPSTATDESDPTQHHAKPYVQTYNQQEFEAAGGKFHLDPYGILRVEFSLTDRGVRMEGHDQVVDPKADYDDHLVGGMGNDVIRGHHGNDRLEGVAGRNILNGGQGDDVIIGGTGNDALIDRHGTNLMKGGGGRNIFIDGHGDDVMIGGKGRDLFVSDFGSNTITGGGGGNLFLLSPEASTTITDFDPAAGDTIGFRGHFKSVKEFREATEIRGGDEKTPGDLVIHHGDDRETVLVGGAAHKDSAEEFLFDFFDEEDRAKSVAEILAGLTLPQLDAVLDETTVGENNPIFQGLPPETIEATLPQGHAVQALIRLYPAYTPDSPEDNGTVPAHEEFPLPHVSRPEEKVPAPVEPEDDDGSSSGGACFVATATYGDPTHPDVVLLRALRDKILVNYLAGRLFIRFYWWIGPKMAEQVSPENFWGRLSRKLLEPLVSEVRRNWPEL